MQTMKKFVILLIRSRLNLFKTIILYGGRENESKTYSY